jgi:hypothetical protein
VLLERSHDCPIPQHIPPQQASEQQLKISSQEAPAPSHTHVPLLHKREQQSLLLPQPVSPFGIQKTHVLAVLSQTLRSWTFEQQVVLLLQTLLSSQHDPPTHVCPEAQLPQVPPQPSSPHVFPAQFGVQHPVLVQV